MGIYDWLYATRKNGPAPVEIGNPSWVRGDVAAAEAQGGVSPKAYNAMLKKMEQQQAAIDTLRRQSESGGGPGMFVGGGGGDSTFGARPEIYVPGNTGLSALGQALQGGMAGYQQQELDKKRAMQEEEMRKSSEAAALEYAGMQGAGAVPGMPQVAVNPSAGEAQQRALPLSALLGGSNESLLERQMMQQVNGDFQDATDSLYPAPVEYPPSIPPEGLEIDPSELQPQMPQNGILPGAAPTSGALPMAASGNAADPRSRRFMAAYNMAMNPMSAEIGKSLIDAETGVSSGRRSIPADIQIAEYRARLSPEQRDEFDRHRWNPQFSDFGGFKMNPVTREQMSKTPTPGDVIDLQKEAVAVNSTPERLTAFMNDAGGDPQRAYQLQQQAIQGYTQMAMVRAQGGQQTAPASVLPQATGEVRGVDGTAAELNQMSQMRQRGMSDSQIAADMTAQARALPKAIAAGSPLPSSGQTIATPAQVAGETKLAQDRAATVASKEAELPAARTALASADEKTARVNKMIDDAIEGVGYMSAGLASHTSIIGGTPAADLEALLQPIFSSVGLGNLQELKNAAPSGASGFGSLTEKEFERLASTLGSLAQKQSPEQLRKNLNEVKASIQRINELSKAAFEERYGNESAPPAPGIDPEFEAWKKAKGL